MTRSSRSVRLARWLVPAGVAAAVAVASFASTVVARAAGTPKLAPATAAQLLAAVQNARPAGMSGTVVETAKLGLPSLPDMGPAGGGSGLSVENLITGSHTIRVWFAGPTKQRIALLGQLSESDVIHNGTDLYIYQSDGRTVTHDKVPASTDIATSRGSSSLSSLPTDPAKTPQQLAQQALSAIDPTTSVTVDDNARVAGRAAYQLVVAPKDARSLIGSIRIAVDSATSVPLRVQIFARGASSPALQIGFTDVSFNVPSDSVFDFTPPPGSTTPPAGPPGGPGGPKVIRPSGGVDKGGPGQDKGGPGQVTTPQASSGKPTVLGKGWTAVAKLPSSALGGTNLGGSPDGRGSALGILNQIATPVAGGHIVTGALATIFLADDGTVYVGAVTQAALMQVVSTGQGL
jgi:outer membrane lipoprotein-sorting protein